MERKQKRWENIVKLYAGRGYSLPEQECIRTRDGLTCYDEDGYKFFISPKSLEKGCTPRKFAISNPHTVWNIKNLWLSEHAPNYVLIDGEYKGRNEKMTWKHKSEDISEFEASFAEFQRVPHHPSIPRKRKVSTTRSPKEIRSKVENYLFDKEDWFLIEGQEYEYETQDTKLRIEHIYGYYSYVTLGDILKKTRKTNSNISLYWIGEPEMSIHNLKTWLLLNSTYKLKDGQFYRGSDEKYTFECSKHGEFSKSLTKITKMSHCTQCNKENRRTQGIVDKRDSVESKEWKQIIYDNDNYMCVCCGLSNNGLNAHHLDGWNWCEEKRVDVSNGVTLCDDCHYTFHGIYGYGDNTRHQFYEFMEKGMGVAIRDAYFTPDTYLDF